MTYTGEVTRLTEIPGGHVLVTVGKLCFAVEPGRELRAPVLAFLIPAPAAARYRVGHAVSIQMGPTLGEPGPGLRVIGD